jgi:hypothetical protein
MTDQQIQEGQAGRFKVDMFAPRDAVEVAALFRSVYGEGYPVKLVYNPEQLTRAFNNRDNIPLVVRTAEGDIIGYEAFYRSSPNPKLYELGQGLISPEYRNLGIINHVNRYACDVVAPSLNMDAIFGEAVCNHIYMQRSWMAFKTVVTALEVDLMPAEAYAKEGSASGRVATLTGFRTYRSEPHAVHIPRCYEGAVRQIYARWDDERTVIAAPGSERPEGVSTEIKTQIFDFAHVARLAVHEGGKDFPAVFNEQEKVLLDQGIIVIQVWLKLSWPWIGAIVEHLRKKGYFLGGVLPRWFGVDGLLMQKIAGTPNWDGIKLYEDSSKELMEIVKADWESQSYQTSGYDATSSITPDI